jgi:PAS domain S-box-containing protein
MPTKLVCSIFALSRFILVALVIACGCLLDASAAELKLTPQEQTWLREHPEIRVRVSPTYPPLEFFQNGHYQGLAHDYLMLVGKKLGITFTPVSNIAWKDALEMVKTRQGLDMILLITRNPEREQYFAFTKDYLTFPIVIYTKKSNNHITDVKDLAGHTVAIEKGYIKKQWLERDVPEVRFLEVEGSQTALEAVSSGRADAYVGNIAVGNYYVDKRYLTDLEIAAPTPYKNDGMAMGVRKDWPDLANILDKTLASLTDAEHREIRQRWLAVRYEHGIRWIDVVKWGAILTAIGLVFIVQLRRMVRLRTAELVQEMERRQNSEELQRQSEKRYQELVEQANSAIVRMSPAGEITFINKYAEHLFGYSREEVIGKNVIGTIVPEKESSGRDLTALMNALLKHPEELSLNENENIDRNGQIFWIRWANRPVFDEQGNLVELLCIGQDITERRLLEQQVKQQQKLESIGLLAGGISHDLNNLLTPIFGYTEMIRKKFKPDEKIFHQASQIIEAASKARDLIKQLLSFSRKQVLTVEDHDLNEIIASFSGIMRRTIRENIEIRHATCADPCPVKVDRNQIEQILLNFAVNAQDAITGNGTITIETGHNLLDEEYCAIHPGATPGRYIMFAFTDSGCGMDDATLAQIFEPFFTTKVVGHGTGLGLSTVYGIVKQHNGYIDVQSKIGRGTCFRIYLQENTDTSATIRKPEKIMITPVHTGGVILLVEDNQMVMEFASELLENHGYTVFAATKPSEALKIAKENCNTIDLLVSDVVLPEMSGPELHGHLCSLCPALTALFISGYASSLTVHNGHLEENVNFLAKPFTSEVLLGRVAELLAVGRTTKAGS